MSMDVQRLCRSIGKFISRVWRYIQQQRCLTKESSLLTKGMCESKGSTQRDFSGACTTQLTFMSSVDNRISDKCGPTMTSIHSIRVPFPPLAPTSRSPSTTKHCSLYVLNPQATDVYHVFKLTKVLREFQYYRSEPLAYWNCSTFVWKTHETRSGHRRWQRFGEPPARQYALSHMIVCDSKVARNLHELSGSQQIDNDNVPVNSNIISVFHRPV